MNCTIITILIMTIKAAQYSEMTKKAFEECDMSTNVDSFGSLPNIPTIIIDGSADIDVNLQNERSESLENLNSASAVEAKSSEVEIAESILNFTFEGKNLHLRLTKFEKKPDLSTNTTNKLSTTPLGASLSPEIKYSLLEDDYDSFFFFNKSISGNDTVIESSVSNLIVTGQKDNLEGETTLSNNFTKSKSTETVSQLGDHDQAEASSLHANEGSNISQNNSIQETVHETKESKNIPNGDIPNRTLSRSSSRKPTVPRSFLADSGYEIYNSEHNFKTSNLTTETSTNTKEDEDNFGESSQEKSSKKKKTKISWLGCFSKRSYVDSDGDYYKKISEDSDSD